MSPFLAHFKISISNDALQSSHLIRVHGILGLTLVRAVIPHLPHRSSPLPHFMCTRFSGHVRCTGVGGRLGGVDDN